MAGVFLSYAKPDSALVTRVYEDLTRARVGDVWCYEITSKYGTDFRREYAEKIRSADTFILFDSRHARASNYVKHEVEICRATRGINQLICLTEPEGPWRHAEIFVGQNFLVYIEFLKYEAGIRALCSSLRAHYVPRFTFPRDVDFEAEVRDTAHLFPLEARQAVFDQYDFFRANFGRNPALAEAQLVVLISQYLEAIDAPVVSPLLALGALRIDAKRYLEADEAFAAATVRAPQDPRGWAGRGRALYALGDYRTSAQSWQTCLACINESNSDAHRASEGEVRYNAAAALLALGETASAWNELEPCLLHDETRAENLVLAGRILLDLRDILAHRMLTRAVDRIEARDVLEAELFIDLVESLRRADRRDLVEPVLARAVELHPFDVDVVRQHAVQLVERQKYDMAVAQYERALKLHPGNLRCLAELAMLLRARGVQDRSKALVERCLDILPSSPTDEYFVGLAHFLDGREETARYFLARSQRSIACSGWPHYRELWDG